MRSIVRARQPALTRITPHQGNRRVIVPNRIKVGGLAPVPQPGYALAMSVGADAVKSWAGFIPGGPGVVNDVSVNQLRFFSNNFGRIQAPGAVPSWGIVGVGVSMAGYGPVVALPWGAINAWYEGPIAPADFAWLLSQLGRSVSFTLTGQ